MGFEASILIVGGRSRIGATLVRELAGRAISVVRDRSHHAGEIVTRDYGSIPDSAFSKIERVVNCVGVSEGSGDLLERVNVAVPLSIAERARRLGVQQMIHLSSFSVYGGASAIGRATAAAPVGAYGKSKLAGDTELLKLSASDFDVAVLRMPLIYATGSMGKLGQILRAWRRLHFLPVPRQDVRRAMIGVELATQVLARLVQERPVSGVFLAADPEPFTYRDAAWARPETLHCLPLPDAAVALARRLAPNVSGRVFSDSALDSSDNLSEIFGFPSRLYSDIANEAL